MKRATFRSAFFNPRILGALLLCAVGGFSILAGTLLTFFYPEAPTKNAKRTLTFEGTRSLLASDRRRYSTAASPTPTPCEGRCTPTPRPRLTPRPRPTPHPRPTPTPSVEGTWTVTGSLNT